MLGIQEEEVGFDQDVITHINTAFLILNQLGVGPEKAFRINDERDTWSDFIGDSDDLESVKTLIYLRVRLLFDPPTNSFTIDAMERSIKELEWRLNAFEGVCYNEEKGI